MFVYNLACFLLLSLSLLNVLEYHALLFFSSLTILTSSADWLQWGRDVCAPGDTSQEHWLLVVPILRPAVLQGRQFAQNKTNVMETVMQLQMTNRIPSISSSAVSGRAHTHQSGARWRRTLPCTHRRVWIVSGWMMIGLKDRDGAVGPGFSGADIHHGGVAPTFCSKWEKE